MMGLRNSVTGLFDDFFSGRPLLARGTDTETGWNWSPAVDIRETDDELVIYALVPGVEKEEIQIEIKDGALVLSGSRKAPAEDSGWLRREQYYGSFYRAFSLPAEIQQDRVSANHKNGVLEIRLPKAEKAKPHKVKVL
ncbi:MAG: Hsp20/alpha crystallin family protein [Elusimicrobia bacterium]|nr:Hsp20/alpha crystallin family protein [Elusimicrobiota bacterium]